jgi:hypothetical protein
MMNFPLKKGKPTLAKWQAMVNLPDKKASYDSVSFPKCKPTLVKWQAMIHIA